MYLLLIYTAFKIVRINSTKAHLKKRKFKIFFYKFKTNSMKKNFFLNLNL